MLQLRFNVVAAVALSHGAAPSLQVGFKTWYPGSDERYIAKCQCVFFATCAVSVCLHLTRDVCPGMYALSNA